MNSRFFYEEILLNRENQFRIDSEWLDTNLCNENAYIIPVWRNKNLFIVDPSVKDKAEAIILTGPEACKILQKADTTIFLGIKDNRIYLAADLNHLDDPLSIFLQKNLTFVDLRELVTNIDPINAGYLAYARAIVYWHQTHQYCGTCGTQTEPRRGGHQRVCLNDNCKISHFPRTDPAVIMLVTHPTEEKCLLGHNKKYRGLRYSTIAGFVEPGEMLEQAVAREVLEETNISVIDVKYKASQPWPFPASIMLGFRAHGTNSNIICHDQELTDAKWFSREEVNKLAKASNMLPAKHLSISRWLIDDWLLEK